MAKNIIFVFSGTGNSLWAAKEIAGALKDCEIVSMGNQLQVLPTGYDRIGFVYPTYAGGMPKRVKEFIQTLDLQHNRQAYFFAVATCGRVSRAQNVITQMHRLLKRRKLTLSYGERLAMYSNYVVRYEMRDTVKEEARQSAKDIVPMIDSIKQYRSNQKTPATMRELESMGFMLIVHKMDKNFSVSDACVNCGICKAVCPVHNIRLTETAKPSFLHHCEHCLACLQNCQAKAINYKAVTRDRKRYVHPDISWRDLAVLNNNKMLDTDTVSHFIVEEERR